MILSTNSRARSDLSVREELRGRPLLHDQATVDEHQPVTHLAGEAHLVRDDQHRHAVTREVAHDVQHLPDHLRVQRRGRLVEQHQLRVHGERSRDRHPLLLPTRQVRRELIGLLGDARRARATRARGSAPHPARRPSPSSVPARCCPAPSCAGRGGTAGRRTRSASAASGRSRPARTGWPSKTTSPASTVSSPLTQRSIVDLPEPGRPRDDDHLTARNAEIDAVEHHVVPERLPDTPKLDQILVIHPPLTPLSNLHVRASGNHAN